MLHLLARVDRFGGYCELRTSSVIIQRACSVLCLHLTLPLADDSGSESHFWNGSDLLKVEANSSVDPVVLAWIRSNIVSIICC